MVKNMRITYAEVSLSFPGLVPLVHSSTVWIHPSYLRLVINRCNSVKSMRQMTSDPGVNSV